jgi:hypothetical protein
MCVCKETDVRESPNDSTLAGGEGQGGRGETFHSIYGGRPVSSVAEHPLHPGDRSVGLRWMNHYLLPHRHL